MTPTTRLAAFCSFPQVMGHEVVADVVRVGPDGPWARRSGQRVVLNPWLSCGPRGIEPPCPACESGDYSLCWSFCDGDIKPGHPHRGVGRCHRRLRRADAGPRQHAVRGARVGARRGGGVRRPVLGVAARHHPPPAAAVGSGPGLRGGLAGVVRRRGAAGALPARRGRGGGALRRPGRSWRAGSARPRCWHTSPGWPSSRSSSRWGGGRLRQPLQGLPMAYPGSDRRRLRHRRQAGDVRSRRPGPGVARNPGEGRRACAGAMGVESAVLQGGRLRGLQRLWCRRG